MELIKETFKGVEIEVEPDGSFRCLGPDGWKMEGVEPLGPTEALREARVLASRRADKVEAAGAGFAFEWNDEQLAAIEAMIDWWNNGSESFFGLFGYAGTGKTSVVQEVCSRLGRSQFNTAMAAPTHKAVGVLAHTSASHGSSRYHYATLHSLLKLRPQKVEGRQVFRRDRPDTTAPIQNYTLVVLDECSMVDEDLWKYLNDEVQESISQMFQAPIRVVVMGDPLQLPPVNDTGDESPTFGVESQVTLSEVMRYAGAVGEAVDEIRDNINSPKPLIPGDASDSYGQIVNYDARNRWMDDLIENARVDHSVKALAWTNRSVNKINRDVRQAIWGQDVDAFVAGERLVAVEAYVQHNNVVLQTEAEIEVIDAQQDQFGGMDCWVLRVSNLHTGEEVKVWTLESRQRHALDRQLKRLARAKKWGEFWPLKEKFAVLRPPYATTVHKSQGSTYRQVYVLQSDIGRAGRRDSFLRNRLMYVAYSRTSNGLMICHD